MAQKVNGLNIEWDVQKDLLNIRKHGVYFEDAAFVFLDERRVEFYDIRHSDDEDRYIVIGVVDEVLFVVYTERGETIRIISARKATPLERRLYYEQNS